MMRSRFKPEDRLMIGAKMAAEIKMADTTAKTSGGARKIIPKKFNKASST